jgi:hypothetical protein
MRPVGLDDRNGKRTAIVELSLLSSSLVLVHQPANRARIRRIA